MSLSLYEQTKQTLDKSANILITFKRQHNPDTVATALAFKLFLEKLGKTADIASDSFTPGTQSSFLPQADCITAGVEGLTQFHICLDLNKNSLKDFSYDVKDNQLVIFLTPKSGAIRPEDIQTKSGEFKYDLIITIDTEDLESLGTVFEKNKDFFYKTTIINFDHKSENENYGQINHIDLNVTSAAELLYSYIQQFDPTLKIIDPQLANCLLCGMIAKTKSFKSIKVTPLTLQTAANLIKAGADRDEIVKHLYYTKSISTLKLWGKVLARLKSDPDSHLAWSFVEEKDFADLQTTPEKIDDVIEELIITAPEAKVITIIYQYKHKLHALLYSDARQTAFELAAPYNPSGSKRLATFTIEGEDLLENGKKIIEEIKAKLK